MPLLIFSICSFPRFNRFTRHLSRLRLDRTRLGHRLYRPGWRRLLELLAAVVATPLARVHHRSVRLFPVPRLHRTWLGHRLHRPGWRGRLELLAAVVATPLARVHRSARLLPVPRLHRARLGHRLH
ncbi:MAG: hypothetical protein ACOY3O_10200, partial [Thermodesulfobacteriota bacterium]